MKIQTETDRMGWVLSRKHVKFYPLSNKIMEKSIFPKYHFRSFKGPSSHRNPSQSLILVGPTLQMGRA